MANDNILKDSWNENLENYREYSLLHIKFFKKSCTLTCSTFDLTSDWIEAIAAWMLKYIFMVTQMMVEAFWKKISIHHIQSLIKVHLK